MSILRLTNETVGLRVTGMEENTNMTATEALRAYVRSAGFAVRDTGAVSLAGHRSVFISVRPNGAHVIMHQSSRGTSYQTFRDGKASKVSARAKLLAELVYLDNLKGA